jgi:hypothetical protein
MLTNYFQIMATALSYNLRFPQEIIPNLSSVKLFGYTTDAVLSFDCFLVDTKLTQIFDNLSFLKVFALAFIPLILISGSLLIFGIAFIRNTAKFKKYSIVTVITIIFLLHISLTQN